MSFNRLSLLWKILLPTSIVLTVVFAAAGWIVQSSVIKTTSQSVSHEASASFQAYESLWKARADRLATVSRILSTMSDVRRVLGTRDEATIRDTASELWSHAAAGDAFFLVADPQGKVIASLGASVSIHPSEDFPEVQAARPRFPEQASGFVLRGGELFQVVVTPVYVQAGAGTGLLAVLVAGYGVDARVAHQLKGETGGSEFLFVAGNNVVTSTLPAAESSALAPRLIAQQQDDQYLALATPLVDIGGGTIGQLFILRSFAAARQNIASLRNQIVALWISAMAASLLVTFFVARRIMRPVAELDRAAAEIARQNYGYRVDVHTGDELGRLAGTFNAMSESIQRAREELKTQERISTIGRLSTSIVHDLRNPLAAIYAGAEMLFDTNLPAPQVRRLANNIYRASRGIQEMLQQLLNVSRGRSGAAEICPVRDVIAAAWSAVETEADAQRVELINEIPDALECPMERARMERVFRNLFENAVEVMPAGGTVRIHARTEESAVLIAVRDTGPGIRAEVRSRLFQPFVTFGKKNGLGLGLALARQTLLDHGGDLWVNGSGPGAEFHMRLPKERRA
ncbi:MAG: HAMP domain-containing protein [Acidobacteriia bacterium]|nr:HAMP domain-containing protein [Terriglobia bacterium]